MAKEKSISIILDSYDDMFSDFDPRPTPLRALSDDFLMECKKASVDKENKIHLVFSIPRERRNSSEESKIKKRLKEHFNKHFLLKQKEIKKIKTRGLFWFFSGAIIMVLASLLPRYEGFIFELLKTMAEPASWFFFWEGLGKIFIEVKSKSPNYNFYRKMTDAEISFIDD